MPTEHESGGGRFGASLDVTIDLPLAAAGSRGLARAVDTLIYLFLQIVTGSVLGGLLFAVYLTEVVGAGVLIGIWFVLVFVVQWSVATSVELYMRGQTPGKRLLGLRTVRDDGGTLTFVPALLRNLLRVDSFPVLGLVDLAVMFVHPASKRLGDLAAGTVVIDEGSPAVARTWPPSMSATDVALLELWFARAPNLAAERRAAIAARLVTRLVPAYPTLLDPDAAGVFEPVGALERLAPAVGATSPPTAG